MKPIIGLIPRPSINQTQRNMFSVYQEIKDAVWKEGGIPIALIPPHQDTLQKEEIEAIQKAIDLCDGILAGGGDNFYDYDRQIIQYAYDKNIPVLGICLGMQTMATMEQGKLSPIGNDKHQKKGLTYAHPVSIEDHTQLREIIKEPNILVNSRHQEHVEYTHLKVNAISKDHIIEGVEDTHKDFFIGVQWHPEDMFEYDIKEKALIDAFIEACKR